ncbi:MAG: response regulator, partial [Pseudomonadota bacterium]|nr:response regulator [Pseudomonadota bacterium]
PGSIDLLFTDIVMPLMGGKELSEKLTAVRPQIEVLFTSGHLGDRVNRDDQIFKGDRFINKPYNVSEVLIKIRRLLDNREV